MSKKSSRDKIISNTASKLIIKINLIDRALSKDEVELFHSLIDKIRQHDNE